MLCRWCQTKVIDACRQARGRGVASFIMQCDFEGNCNVDDFVEKILEIFPEETAEVKKNLIDKMKKTIEYLEEKDE